MIKIHCLFLSFLLVLSSSSLAAGGGNNEEVLQKLDQIIHNKSIYHVQKEKEITLLKQSLERTNDTHKKYELCGSLFKAYLNYQADSALYYVNEKMNLLPLLNSVELRSEVLINRGEVMGMMGMYNEAQEQLRQVNTSELTKETLAYYYRTYRAYYGWVADYTTSDIEKVKYLQKTDAYRDSVLMTLPPSMDRNLVWAEKEIANNKRRYPERNLLPCLDRHDRLEVGCS